MHGRRAVHQEALPPGSLIAIETAQGTVIAALIGCAAMLVLGTLGMLVVGAFLGSSVGPPDRLGRGIIASAAAGIVCFALLAGVLTTAGRLALAAFYASFDPTDKRLEGTLLVRGQVSPSPVGPAAVSVIAIGGLALLAAIVCVVLATEHAGRLDDEVHRAAFIPWMTGTVVFTAVMLLSATAVWWLSVVNRRWVSGPFARLTPGVVGYAGRAVRITSRAQRRAVRRGWNVFDWAGWAGGALVAAGAGVVFLGVFLHQPGLYAVPVRYSADVELTLAVGTIIGGAMLFIGLVIAIAAGIASTGRTIRSLHQAEAQPASLTDDARARVRAATIALSDAVTVAQAMWAAVAVAVGGWWFAVHVETPVDGSAAIVPEDVAGIGVVFLLVAWSLCGVLLIGARVALQTKGPAVRNRFGYDAPTEPDDREFPNLPLLGQ